LPARPSSGLPLGCVKCDTLWRGPPGGVIHCPGRLALWLGPRLIDVEREVVVCLEGREILRTRVEPDARLLLEELDRSRDPSRLAVGRLEIDLEAVRTW